MKNNTLQIFDYEGQSVRSTVIDGEVWFVAKDVCDILGLADVTSALRSLDDDEKMTLQNQRSHSGQRGGAQSLNVINEPGLYALVFKSSKPEAKAFARWVRHDLLPQVMHTGSYNTAGEKRSPKSFYAGEHIIDRAFKCQTKADCQQVEALDRMFQGIYGYSALETAGIQLEVPAPQPEVPPKPNPQPRNHSAELWEHIVATFSPNEWFTTSELKQSLAEVPVSIRQIRRYLLSFVANKQLKRRGDCKGTEYSIK